MALPVMAAAAAACMCTAAAACFGCCCCCFCGVRAEAEAAPPAGEAAGVPMELGNGEAARDGGCTACCCCTDAKLAAATACRCINTARSSCVACPCSSGPTVAFKAASKSCSTLCRSLMVSCGEGEGAAGSVGGWAERMRRHTRARAALRSARTAGHVFCSLVHSTPI